MSSLPPPEGRLHRAARPFLLYAAGVAVIAICVGAFASLWPLFLRAVERWSNGDHVDWGGAAVILGALGTLLTTVWGIAAQILWSRSAERRVAISTGVAPVPSTPSAGLPAPPEGSPSGGLVNNEAIS